MIPTYVIVFAYQQGEAQRFWRGTSKPSWVIEYPDADVYADEPTGRRALRTASARAALRAGEAALVRDYGMTDEQVVCWSTS